MDERVRAFVAELIGVFALVFVGAATACAVGLPDKASNVGMIAVALAEGSVFAVALTITRNVSGGFLNPAITLALWVFRRIDGTRALSLIGAQVLGAVLAGALVRLISGDNVGWLDSARLGTPHLGTTVFGSPPYSLSTLLSGIGVEFVLTFLLTFAIFGTMIDPRTLRLGGLGGLGAGLTLCALILAGFRVTGAAANPARWLGPAVWEYTAPTLKSVAFADHPVYWMGPILGAMAAAGLYIKVILPEEKQEE
jgi:aquaporin Z